MAITITCSWIQTAHYNIIYVASLLLVLSLSSTSRAASIGSVVPTITSTTSCVCTTQVPTSFQGIYPARVKEFPPTEVSTVLLPPSTVPTKLTFTLRKRIKMADQLVKGDGGVQEVGMEKKVAPKEVDKAVASGKTIEDRKGGNKTSAQDNIVFPKDEESMTTTSEGPKTTMPVGNRILIGGAPNDGYGRDANGEIVEIFQ